MTPLHLALVAAGGALGSVARYAAGLWLLRALGDGFPWGTLAVNVIGSAAIGALAGGAPLSDAARLFLITGFLGGFTTFSAFSLDTGALFARAPALAGLYVAVTLIGGLGAFATTHAATAALTSRP